MKIWGRLSGQFADKMEIISPQISTFLHENARISDVKITSKSVGNCREINSKKALKIRRCL